MKRECLISRLGEPNIAHLYVIESDQNLINNIRVLCTRQPQTLRYFVPEKLFWEIRNGENAAITAECYDGYGRHLFSVDPLKVLSEQIRDEEIFLAQDDGLEIRLQVEGYELPVPDDETYMDFLSRPDKYRRKPPGGDRARGTSTASRSDARRNGRAPGNEPDPTFRRRKRYPVTGIVLALIILLAAAGVWFLRDTSVRRFEERMEAGRYSEAVTIYNEEILGHENREEKADPQVRSAVESIRDDYMAENCSYEDASAYLHILTGFDKKALSDKAQSALDEVELYQVSSATLQEGIAYMEEREYLKAIETLLKVEESSTIYREAQENLNNCVGLLIKSTADLQSEEECLEAIELVDAAIEMLPENEALTECRDTCRSKYTDLVRSNAIAEADELAAAGDYAGAFERLGKGLEALPEDEILLSKKEEYEKAFVVFVTKEAIALFNSGDSEGAGAYVESASEIYSCEALDNLRAQIEEGAGSPKANAAKYEAGKAVYTELSGTIRDKIRKNEFSFVAQESGPCTISLTKADTKFKVQLQVKEHEGEVIAKETGLTSGSEVKCTVEKGRAYEIEVTAAEGQGSYAMLLSQQKNTVDLSAYDDVQDSIDYPEQCNNYSFVPEYKGIYRFDVLCEEVEYALKISIYDSKGAKISGGELADGQGVTTELNAGEKYSITAEPSEMLAAAMRSAAQQAAAAQNAAAGQTGTQQGVTGAETGQTGTHHSGAETGQTGTHHSGADTGQGAAGTGQNGTEQDAAGTAQADTAQIRAAQTYESIGYVLSIGKQEPATDITGRFIVPGEVAYENQKKSYTFKAAESGEYRITMGNMAENCRVKLQVYSSLGDRISGADSLGNGESVTAEFEEGQGYQIQLTQDSGTGIYTMTIAEE